MTREKKKKDKKYSIGMVATTYNIHEQTLRLYEREGLLIPSRSEKNTRYYTDQDLERLKLILSLTRDMGVNLAGVQIIINLREQMDDMKRELNSFLEHLHEKLSIDLGVDPFNFKNALVRIAPAQIFRVEEHKE